MAGKATPKDTAPAVDPDLAALAALVESGELETDASSAIPVTFNGETYPGGIKTVPIAVLAAATAEDLASCGNSQATAVRKRVLRAAARKAGLLN